MLLRYAIVHSNKQLLRSTLVLWKVAYASLSERNQAAGRRDTPSGFHGPIRMVFQEAVVGAEGVHPEPSAEFRNPSTLRDFPKFSRTGPIYMNERLTKERRLGVQSQRKLILELFQRVLPCHIGAGIAAPT